MKRCRQKGEAAKRFHSNIFHCNIGFSSIQIEDSQQTQDLPGLRVELLNIDTHLVTMKPICWITERDVKLGLGVN